MVTVVNREPHPSVVKEVVCKHCGVTLSYVPADRKEKKISDYLGDCERYWAIECPECKHDVRV